MAKLALVTTNLDFEYELANGTKDTPPRILSELSDRWRYLLRLLPGQELAVCFSLAGNENLGERDDFDGASLLSWGLSPRIFRLVETLNLNTRWPNQEVVTEVNDKRFSHRVEQELGVALPFSRIVASLEELHLAIADCPHDWVLKHPFGFSGRDRMTGKKHEISPSALGWAKRQFGKTWSLLFEPWVQERLDFSMHFDVSPERTVKFVGHTQLQTDPGGVHRGNRWTPEPCCQQALEVARAAVELVAARGYWGPVGVDAVSGILLGGPIVRPVVELNCRWSFGRMCLALRDHLPKGWSFRWELPSRVSSGCEPRAVEGILSPQISRPGCYRLPEYADPDGSSGSIVYTAPSTKELDFLGP